METNSSKQPACEIKLLAREAGYKGDFPAFVGEDPPLVKCTSVSEYIALHAHFPNFVTLNLQTQLKWLDQQDLTIGEHITDDMIGAAINSCLQSMTDGMDMVDHVHSALETAIDAYLAHLSETGAMPPWEDEGAKLSTELSIMLFGFVDRCYEVFKDSGMPFVDMVGAPYKYKGRTRHGTVLLQKRDVLESSGVLEYRTTPIGEEAPF